MYIYIYIFTGIIPSFLMVNLPRCAYEWPHILCAEEARLALHGMSIYTYCKDIYFVCSDTYDFYMYIHKIYIYMYLYLYIMIVWMDSGCVSLNIYIYVYYMFTKI